MSFNNQQMGETGSTLYHKLVWGILIIMAKASAEILRLHRWTAIVYKASSQAPHVAFCDPNLALVFFFQPYIGYLRRHPRLRLISTGLSIGIYHV